ncbi:MAG: hypothetical protein J5X21_16550, partial [Candidatus Accumulibacter sp.]|nr:hypothetical protein [Candidatus Accumulibacter conexus]
PFLCASPASVSPHPFGDLYRPSTSHTLPEVQPVCTLATAVFRIIVDFRALDTLGEIAVIALALAAALPLLRLARGRNL